jgi:integrase
MVAFRLQKKGVCGPSMSREKITLRVVANMLPGDTIWDTTVRGIGVRRQQRDPVYVLKYRFQSRQRFYTIGKHGAPWTPDTARSEALRLLGSITSHETPRDPSAERNFLRAQLTFAEFAEQYLTQYAEARRKPRTAAEDRRAIACFKFLLFTGARLSEILTLRWEWIDCTRGVARLPDSKTGRKNLVLPTPALELLMSLPTRATQGYVLPGIRLDSHFVGIQKPWQRLRKKAGLHDVRLHDLRHVFASIAVSAGDSLYTVGAILGYRQPTTTQRYAHLSTEPVRAAADKTAVRIAGMLASTNAPASAPEQLPRDTSDSGNTVPTGG